MTIELFPTFSHLVVPSTCLESYLVTSSGGVKEHFCEALGRYVNTGRVVVFPGKCTPNLPIYKHECNNIYLFVNCYDDWVITYDITHNAYIFGDKPSKQTPPISGWRYWRAQKVFSDTTMRVVAGKELLPSSTPTSALTTT